MELLISARIGYSVAQASQRVNRSPGPDSYPADAPFAAMGSTPPADSMSFQKWQET